MHDLMGVDQGTSQAALGHALAELEERQRSNEESFADVMAFVGGAAQ